MISEQIFLITNNKIYDYFSVIYGSRYVQASVLKMTCNKVMTHCNNSLIHCLCKDFYKSSHRRCSVRKGVFRNFAKLTGKHLCLKLFLNKVLGLRPATLLKRILCHRCFPINFSKFLRTPI